MPPNRNRGLSARQRGNEGNRRAVRQQEILRGGLNLGSLQEEFGTGIEREALPQLSGNRRFVRDIQTNLETTPDATALAQSLSQVIDPSLTGGQQRSLTQVRGLAAARGITGGAANATVGNFQQNFLASNRLEGLRDLGTGIQERLNRIITQSQGFFQQAQLRDAEALTNFGAEDFRSVFQTFQNLGLGENVDLLLARDAGVNTRAGIQDTDENARVFGLLDQFVNTRLTGQQQFDIARNSRRLPARFIAPGENARDVFIQRRDRRRGQLTEQALAANRATAASELQQVLGQRIQDLRIASETFLNQAGSLGAQSDNPQSVLSADFGNFENLFSGLGITTQQALQPQPLGATFFQRARNIAVPNIGFRPVSTFTSF